jgi:hypothetical protein
LASEGYQDLVDDLEERKVTTPSSTDEQPAAVSEKSQAAPVIRKRTPPSRSIRRPYPRETLEEALRVPFALKNKNGGNPWPPADVAAAVGLSPKTPTFFYLAAASREFGLTDGGRDSKLIALTELGRDVVYAANKDDEETKLREALLRIEIFRKVLDYFKSSQLPEMQYLSNTLVREFQLDPSLHEEFARLFRENCAFLKIGAGFSSGDTGLSRERVSERPSPDKQTVVLAEPRQETGRRCFVAMPFRERESTRPRGFFDEVLRALIAPAGRDAGFEVVTANRE